MKPVARSQRGAALLVAMVVLTLVSTMAAGMVWQQWRAIEVEGAERARAQAGWILTGALDWGRLVLREDARTGGADSLDEIWAMPLAEARLSTFLAQDRDNNSEGGPEAFLSGSIRDVQARYNLRNLVAQGKVVAKELAVLKRLCEAADVAPGTADQIAAGLLLAWQLDNGSGEAPTEGAALAPHSVAQLSWLGIRPEDLQRLQPFVALLPVSTPVNLNTASLEVISSVFGGLDRGSAERLDQARRRDAFKNIEQARAYIGGTDPIDPNSVGVSSRFFEISGRLRLEGRVLEERSIVERRGLEVNSIMRERHSVLSKES